REPRDSAVTVSPAAGGPAGSLKQVFDDQAPFIWRSLRHLGIRESDLEDIFQEVFVVIHRKLADFEQRSSLRTWIYGICIRVAKDYRRRAYVRRELAVAHPPVTAEPASQERDYLRTEARRLMNDILNHLDMDKRAVFVLYEIEGLPMKQVAEAVGCPLQTAYSRLHAARRLVVEAAQRMENGGGAA
ncbi:MAG TPA: sigma-70 family RNA polymerase sigma factor, partial [Polyangiaceae bacterium]